jgi:uncharacterized protein YqhQ
MATGGFPYGGQAVPEGVMMRGLHQATVAVRRPDGLIALRHERLDARRRQAWQRAPLLRGLLLLGDTLSLGMRSLAFASQVAAGEEETQLSAEQLRGLVLTSLAMLVGIFFVLPLLVGELLAWALARSLPELGAAELIVLREGFEALLRLGLLVGYIALLGRSPQVQRVFGYHGAEHKAVNAHEAGAPLTVESVRAFPLIHPRCGTSFLVVVILISIMIFVVLGGMPFWARLLARIALVPLIAALAYELLRLGAAHYTHPWVQRTLAPLLSLQRLTTREPDDTMIEVAIAALVPVLQADGRRPAQGQEAPVGVAPEAA